MTNEIAKVSPVDMGLNDQELARISQIEEVIGRSELALSSAAGRIARGFAMAKGVATLRSLITDEMMAKYFMPLMNTKLGFRTDRDPKRREKNGDQVSPYSMEVVRECLIEGFLRG